MRRNEGKDSGASLIGYALMVMLIAVTGIGAVSAVGQKVSLGFLGIGNALASQDVIEPELTSDEKWDKAKADYAKALADAKAQKTYEIAAAKYEYQQQLAKNEGLPKSERKAANQAARASLNNAKAQAIAKYQSAVADATTAKNTAKADWKASK